MEVSTSTGRIDLYNVCSHEIYEVKPDRPEHIEAGKAQLERYMRGNRPLNWVMRVILSSLLMVRFITNMKMLLWMFLCEPKALLFCIQPNRLARKNNKQVPEPVVVPERARERERQYALQPSWTTAAAMAIFLWGLITPLPGDEAIGLGLLLAP